MNNSSVSGYNASLPHSVDLRHLSRQIIQSRSIILLLQWLRFICCFTLLVKLFLTFIVLLFCMLPPAYRRASYNFVFTLFMEPINPTEEIQTGLNEANLERLVVTNYNKTSIESAVGDKTICEVCLENYKPGHFIVQLPCRHIFCKICIFTWLKEKATCPSCRDYVQRHFS